MCFRHGMYVKMGLVLYHFRHPMIFQEDVLIQGENTGCTLQNPSHVRQKNAIID